jgi:hypothetical protein
MSQTLNTTIAVVGIDIGKNSFHIVGHEGRGAIVLRQKWSRGQVEARFANMPPYLVGMEACVGAHHLSRKLRCELPRILATPPDVLSPRMVRIIEDLAGDWRRLDERVEGCRTKSKPSRARILVASG